jgi:hypothetical protein
MTTDITASGPSGFSDAAGEPFALHAWLDESMHEAVPGISEPMYLLAAAVADPAACDDIRDTLRALRPGKKPRLHWREEDGPLKEKVAATIAGADFCGLVVVGVPADLRKQERARSQCMEAMILRLQEIGVTQVWIENRTPSLNKRDRLMVDAMRSKRILVAGTRVDFARPLEEPMLWIPDALAGSSGMARKGSETVYRDLMGHTVEEIEILIR